MITRSLRLRVHEAGRCRGGGRASFAGRQNTHVFACFSCRPDAIGI